MISFSFRAKRDTGPHWGPKGRKIWVSDCGAYQVEERWHFQGLEIPKRERYLALYREGKWVLGRSKTKKAAIARCTQHDNQRKKRSTHEHDDQVSGDSCIVRRR